MILTDDQSSHMMTLCLEFHSFLIFMEARPFKQTEILNLVEEIQKQQPDEPRSIT